MRQDLKKRGNSSLFSHWNPWTWRTMRPRKEKVLSSSSLEAVSFEPQRCLSFPVSWMQAPVASVVVVFEELQHSRLHFESEGP